MNLKISESCPHPLTLPSLNFIATEVLEATWVASTVEISLQVDLRSSRQTIVHIDFADFHLIKLHFREVIVLGHTHLIYLEGILTVVYSFGHYYLGRIVLDHNSDQNSL
jgi:hypothetical protein